MCFPNSIKNFILLVIIIDTTGEKSQTNRGTISTKWGFIAGSFIVQFGMWRVKLSDASGDSSSTFKWDCLQEYLTCKKKKRIYMFVKKKNYILN